MALKWLEGFGLHGASNMCQSLSRKWKGGVQKAGGLFMVPGRLGGWAARMGIARIADCLVTPAFTPHSTWIIGFAWKPRSDFLDGTLLKLIAPDGIEQVSLRILPKQQQMIHAYRGDGKRLASFPVDWCVDVWQYLEMKCRIDNTNGMIAVRVNGQPAGQQFVGQTRISPAFNSVCSISISGVSGGYDLADIYMFDGDGNTNNDFVDHAEDYAVVSMLPSGAAEYTEWQPTKVTRNFQASLTNDQAFVRAERTGQTDTYRFGSTNSRRLQGDVRGMVCQVCCKRNKEYGHPPKMSLLLGTDEEHAIASFDVDRDSYDTLCFVQERHPGTGEKWFAEDAMSLKAGCRLQAINDRTMVCLNSLGIEAFGAIQNIREMRGRCQFSLTTESMSTIQHHFVGDFAIVSLLSRSTFSKRDGWDRQHEGQGVMLRLQSQSNCGTRPTLSYESGGVPLRFEGQAGFRRIVSRQNTIDGLA